MGAHRETVAAYNIAAASFKQTFETIGPRTEGIELALRFAPKPAAKCRAVEIGCAAGRDAAAIMPRVAWYEGFDPSEGMLAFARARLPGARFVRACAQTYRYPQDIDVVFAFGVLHHLPHGALKDALARAAGAMTPGGVLLLTMYASGRYLRMTRVGDIGHGVVARVFYFYRPQQVRYLAREVGLQSVYADCPPGLEARPWMRMVLRRPSH